MRRKAVSCLSICHRSCMYTLMMSFVTCMSFLTCFSEKVKGHSGSLPNLNHPNNVQQQQQQQSNSNSHQSTNTTEPAEPKVKQPNTIPVKRSPTSTPNSKSSLRQPSPTKLRAASPSRSGIPVRLSMSERSAIPRPRSAIISPRIQASTLPRAWVFYLLHFIFYVSDLL